MLGETGARVRKWLVLTPMTGRIALVCGIAAVGFPTAVRAALDGVVTGCEFTPYVPFVLVSAIVLRWWQAALVALASVAIMGGIFEGSLFHVAPCFIPAAGTFAATSAIMIGIASVLRRLVAPFPDRATDQPAGGIVFSLDKGHVWANWYGLATPVRLGTRNEVSYMMQDFLAQEELASRLNRQPVVSDGSRLTSTQCSHQLRD